jgi:hypothetical protein
VGIITLKDLLRFLSMKIELEGLEEGCPEPAPVRPDTEGRIPSRACADTGPVLAAKRPVPGTRPIGSTTSSQTDAAR